jgi:hypothetical protein
VLFSTIYTFQTNEIWHKIDSKMIYTFNVEIYTGKQPAGPFCVSNKPTNVVMRLAKPIYARRPIENEKAVLCRHCEEKSKTSALLEIKRNQRRSHSTIPPKVELIPLAYGNLLCHAEQFKYLGSGVS